MYNKMTDKETNDTQSSEDNEIDMIVKKYAKNKQLSKLANKNLTAPPKPMVKKQTEPAEKKPRFRQRRTPEEIEEAVKTDKNPFKIRDIKKVPDKKIRTTTKVTEIEDEQSVPIIIKRKKKPQVIYYTDDSESPEPVYVKKPKAVKETVKEVVKEVVKAPVKKAPVKKPVKKAPVKKPVKKEAPFKPRPLHRKPIEQYEPHERADYQQYQRPTTSFFDDCF